MADTEINLLLDSTKYDAMKVALEAEGKTAEAECQALLDALYEQMVAPGEWEKLDEAVVKGASRYDWSGSGSPNGGVKQTPSR